MLHYDGMPLNASFIVEKIGEKHGQRQSGLRARVTNYELHRQTKSFASRLHRKINWALRCANMKVLCRLCVRAAGHDSVTAALIQAIFELDIEPHKLAKMSGIGCSSKTPAYFVNQSHGFNSVHGRMASVTTGANAANQ